MGAVKKVDRPNLFPGMTTWGRTSGPVVYVGALIADTDKVVGVHVFHDERESREILHAWGWPTPEQYAELAESLEAAGREIAALKEQLERAGEDTSLAVAIKEGLERVYQEREADGRKAVAAPKRRAA